VGSPLRNGRNWDRNLESGLPDSRLKDPSHKMVYRGRQWWEKVFCANCGCDAGLMTAEWSAHCFYLCQLCAETYGQPPGTMEIPEKWVRLSPKNPNPAPTTKSPVN
jgi:hypothetical protein